MKWIRPFFDGLANTKTYIKMVVCKTDISYKSKHGL